MLTAEVFNWTGHVLMAPRTRLKAALNRPEASHTGVYVLVDSIEGTNRAYIGESENVAARIRDHDAKQDWWDFVLLVSTLSNGLHKAHVKYLEARLVEKARRTATAELVNGNTPPRSSLSEAAASNMEVFLDNLDLVLPALGVRIFQENTRQTSDERDAALSDPADPFGENPAFVLRIAKHGLEARAVLRGADFVVLRGSMVRMSWEGASGHSYSALHQNLVQRGVIVSSGDKGEFLADYAFRSPSAAAAIVTGRSANGRIEWRHEETKATYQDWEQMRLEKSEAGD